MVVISNSSTVIDQIKAGSVALRKAASEGESRLQEVMEHFLRELETKQFSAASTDKAKNTGGVSGFAAGEQAPPGDREIVAGIMQEIVAELSSHWQREKQVQRQRQLTLAVNRNDVAETRLLLEAAADPNFLGEKQQTCLHAAAKIRSLEIIRILLQFKANPNHQDATGNSPAHLLPLWAEENTLTMFKLLASNVEVLNMPNEAGVKVARRFGAWCKSGNSGSPYLPGLQHVQNLKELYPQAFESRALPGLDQNDQHPSMHQRVERSSCQINANGKTTRVETWSAPEVRLHVVLIVLPLWGAVEAPVDLLLSGLCGAYPVKFFVLNEFSIPQPAATSIQEDEEHHAKAIEALPLNDKFVMVQICVFPAKLGLCWRFRNRLSGLVLHNGGTGFITEELQSSESFQNPATYFTRLGERWRRGDRKALDSLFGDAVYGDLSEEDESEARRLWYQAELHNESLQALGSAFMTIGSVPDHVRSLSPLQTLPTVIMISDNVAPAFVLDPTRDMRAALMPFAEIEYIQDSKYWWLLEGKQQRRQCQYVIGRLLERVLQSN
eukprot:TRINITY_DN17722_c0_g1_i4.p1 TRINITY_DN17722_c0_g1~~TRINITY_DN17722_c0_g1_i4.p1  ORF type:complete len:632 (-),score=127.05 TRINITY_DN17722_c0_g1_i4:89-1747(-)